MTWRVFLTDSSQPDLDALSPADRAAVTEELFAWVPNGPPRTTSRVVGGVELFEDHLSSGISVIYFVDEQAPYVAIVRVPEALTSARRDASHMDALAMGSPAPPNAG